MHVGEEEVCDISQFIIKAQAENNYTLASSSQILKIKLGALDYADYFFN